MGMFQPTVTPLPTGLSLQGKVVIVTGATAGLGLETSRQALALEAATVVLACRNASKGESTRKALLADPVVKKHNPNADVKVMSLDMDDYRSVQRFAVAVKTELPVVDILILNAGLGFLPKFESGASRHERTLQINYLSNVLLIMELLPHMVASAAKTGAATRITWVGSRSHDETTLASKNPVRPDESVLEHLDNKANYSPLKQYADSKLLCAMWFYELARKVDRRTVVVNMMCPGMIATDMSDNLPLPLRTVAKMVKAVRARPIEQGGWMLLHAATVVGPETHGKFIVDKDVHA